MNSVVTAKSDYALDKRHSLRLIAYGLIALACVAAGLLIGKDASWDQRHFHLYLGYSAVHDRLLQDFYPASTQSYVVPYAFAPYYLLAAAGISDKVIVAILSLLPAAALCAIWEIGGGVVGQMRARQFDVLGASLSVVVAASTPIFLAQVGNTFIDGSTGALVVIGYAILLRNCLRNKPSLRSVAIAAALMGIACGLKLSNAVPAVAGVVLLAAFLPDWRRVASAVALYGFVGVLSTGLIAGPWWWRVYQAFGNPMLPLYNQYFKSDAAETTAAYEMLRFMPVDWLDALLRPLWMASPEKAVYVDVPSPDLRVLVGFLLLVAAAVTYFIKRRTSTPHMTAQIVAQHCVRSALALLAAAFLISWPLWLLTSGNGRYYVTMLVLLGPLTIGLTYYVLPVARWRFYLFSMLIGLQALAVYWGSQLRYQPVDWNGSWFGVEMPDRYRNEPVVFLAMGMESGSMIVPKLHSQSSFINAGGQYPLTPRMPAWRFVQQILDRQSRPTYLLIPVDATDSQGGPVRPSAKKVAALAAGVGMAPTTATCDDIWVRGVTRKFAIESTPGDPDPQVVTHSMLLVACPVTVATVQDAEIERGRARASFVFDRLSERCPLLLPQPAPFTVSLGDSWFRFYIGTDVVAFMTEQEVTIYRPTYYQVRTLGTPEQVERGEIKEFSCDLRREAIPIRRANGILP